MRWLTESHVFTSCSAAFGAFDESVMFQNEFHNMSTLKRNFKGVFQVRVSVRHVLCSLLGVVFVGPVLPLSARRHCILLQLPPLLLLPFLLPLVLVLGLALTVVFIVVMLLLLYLHRTCLGCWTACRVRSASCTASCPCWAWAPR